MIPQKVQQPYANHILGGLKKSCGLLPAASFFAERGRVGLKIHIAHAAHSTHAATWHAAGRFLLRTFDNAGLCGDDHCGD